MSLKMNTLQAEEGLVLELGGRLDTDTSKRAETELEALLRQGHNVMALDLSGLEFLSSAGLRVFLWLVKRARLEGGNVAFFGPQGGVLDVLNVSGFTRILDIQSECQRAEEALRAIASR